jgi:hypothetical protein
MARPFGTKKIATPEILWKHFLDYKEWVKSNPILVQDYIGKDAQMIYRERQRPLTIEGFECYCFDNDIINDLGDYFKNDDGRYSDYAPICNNIRKAVRNNQIEGGMAGIFNPSITQRLNGLTENVNQDIKSNGKEISNTLQIEIIKPTND